MEPASRTSSMEAQAGSVYSNTTHQARGSSTALDTQVAHNTPNRPHLTQRQPINSSNMVTNSYQYTNGTGGQSSEPMVNGNISHYDTIHQATNCSHQHSASRNADFFSSNRFDNQPGPYAPQIIFEDNQDGGQHQTNHGSTQSPIAQAQQEIAENHENQDPGTTIEHSLPTQTWYQTYSPSERLRLGLPRYASDEERRRADERAAAHYQSARHT